MHGAKKDHCSESIFHKALWCREVIWWILSSSLSAWELQQTFGLATVRNRMLDEIRVIAPARHVMRRPLTLQMLLTYDTIPINQLTDLMAVYEASPTSVGFTNVLILPGLLDGIFHSPNPFLGNIALFWWCRLKIILSFKSSMCHPETVMGGLMRLSWCKYYYWE